ncbi:MAG: hypothetical protein JSR17_00040 [Proteobacteria bacterium]|nr:hypothetical protein [Pseudomonadota bacterium]
MPEKRKKQVLFRKDTHKRALADLEYLLNNAFRYGLNVDIQGLFREAASDHLPISIAYNTPDGNKLALASWNLLADVHLGNYYRNVKIFDIIENDPNIKNDNSFKRRAHWLLSYLAEKLIKQGKDVVIDEDEIDNLLASIDFSKERNPEKAKSDARNIIHYFLDKNNPKHEIFIQSLIHSVEIAYAKSQGYLKWEHRFELIKNNKALIQKLNKKDILCFQECTNPEDMLKLLRETSGKNFKMIQHRVSGRTNDHCVIIYNADKYELSADNNNQPQVHRFGLANNTKPCLLARFYALDDAEKKEFVIGSIHHPGGPEKSIKEIKHELDTFQAKAHPQEAVFILGDFNHDRQFFENENIENFEVKMPQKGTMAGPDFGSVNKPIDGVLSNRAGGLDVKTITMPAAPRVELPIRIEFHPSTKLKPM